MLVGVALFEIHIGHAQSLKEKRAVVKSLREKIRHRFEISAAEVGLQELHQRGRIGISFVALEGQGADRMFQSVSEFVEASSGAALVGWTQEIFEFDETASLGIPHIEWTDEEDS